MQQKPFIIPIFIPHQGCPHQCVYCNQRVISGILDENLSKTKLRKTIECFLSFPRKNNRYPTEVAFYGGSFSALPLARQKELLGVVQEYVEGKRINGIRFSTRPDCVDGRVINLWRKFSIITVELGAQSMDDRVLRAAARGHNAETTKKAAGEIKREGWQLGIQLMIGLPRDTLESFRKTIDEVVKIKPDFVRIYPTLVIKDTPLAVLFLKNRYKPLSLHEAIELSCRAYEAFKKAEIKIIRFGLQAEPWMDEPETVLSGPFHPAFGELVKSAYWRNTIAKLLGETDMVDEKLEISLPLNMVSQVRGHKNKNVKWWKKKFGIEEIILHSNEEMKDEMIITSKDNKWRVSC